MPKGKTDEAIMVSVPRWALEYIREWASFDDDGYGGGSWPSQEMERARDAIDAALRS